MDIQTYNKVIAEKEKLESKRKRARSGYTTAEIAFKKDLLRDKVVWYNRKCKDWCAYTKLNHPLFSICCVPKEHPFGKCERFVVFLIIIGISALVGLFEAAVLPDSDPFKDPIYWAYTQGISFGFSLVISVLESHLTSCATCACCQRNSCPKCCRKLFECIGDAFLCVWLVAVIAECVGVSILAFTTTKNGVIYAIGFGGGVVWSWFSAFLKMGLCFCRKWKAEKQNKKNKLNKLKVNYIEYELYVNGNQVEIPPNYRPSRTNTIGSIGSATEAGLNGRKSTVDSMGGSTSPRKQSNVSVQMSPVSQSPPQTQTVYVDQNGNPTKMGQVAQPQIVYGQQPPIAESVVSSVTSSRYPVVQQHLQQETGKKKKSGKCCWIIGFIIVVVIAVIALLWFKVIPNNVLPPGN